MWQIFVWIVFGLVVGAVARLLMPGRQPMGWTLTTVLGVAGSFVGGAIGAFLSGGDFTKPTAGGFIASVAGALVLLLIVGMAAQRKA